MKRVLRVDLAALHDWNLRNRRARLDYYDERTDYERTAEERKARHRKLADAKREEAKRRKETN